MKGLYRRYHYVKKNSSAGSCCAAAERLLVWLQTRVCDAAVQQSTGHKHVMCDESGLATFMLPVLMSLS